MKGLSPVAQYEIYAIFQLCPHAFSSFGHFSFSMMAYTNLHETMLAIDNTMLLKFKKLFTPKNCKSIRMGVATDSTVMEN